MPAGDCAEQVLLQLVHNVFHSLLYANSSDLRGARKISLPPTEFISVEALILH